MKQFFLPLGLILAVIAGIILPGGGIFLADNNGLKIVVFIIFLVSGYQTGPRELTLDTKLLKVFLLQLLYHFSWLPFLAFCLVSS